MKLFRRMFVMAALAVIAMGSASAQERGTTEQAQAMVKKGIAYIKQVGKEKAFAEFANASNKDFHDKDLYLFVYDLNGVNLAHGTNPKMQGKVLLDMKAGDKFIIREMIDTVNKKSSGWVDYPWPNPVTKALEPKSSYVEKHENYLVGCGAYK